MLFLRDAACRVEIMSLTPEQQADLERQVIKIKVIENATLVSVGKGWLSFQTDEEVSAYVKHRIDELKRARAAQKKAEFKTA